MARKASGEFREKRKKKKPVSSSTRGTARSGTRGSDFQRALRAHLKRIKGRR